MKVVVSKSVALLIKVYATSGQTYIMCVSIKLAITTST